jgi:hypothetical protein
MTILAEQVAQLNTRVIQLRAEKADAIRADVDYRQMLNRCVYYRKVLECNKHDHLLDPEAEASLKAKLDGIEDTRYDMVDAHRCTVDRVCAKLENNTKLLAVLINTPPDHDCTATLATELLVMILAYCEHDTLTAIASVNKRWHQIVKSAPEIRQLAYNTRFETDYNHFLPIGVDSKDVARVPGKFRGIVAGQDGNLWSCSGAYIRQYNLDTRTTSLKIRVPVSVPADARLVAVSPCGHIFMHTWFDYSVFHHSTPNTVTMYKTGMNHGATGARAALSATKFVYETRNTIKTFDLVTKTVTTVIPHDPTVVPHLAPSFQTDGVYVHTRRTRLTFYDYKTFTAGPSMRCNVHTWGKLPVAVLDHNQRITTIQTKNRGLVLYKHTFSQSNDSIRRTELCDPIVKLGGFGQDVAISLVVGTRLVVLSRKQYLYVR